MLHIKNLCLFVGFAPEQTLRLLKNKPVEHSGTLYSEEYKRKFAAKNVTARIAADSKDRSKLRLYIDGKTICEWFKE